MGESIVITSGKGGVGKTITTANIGVGLAKLGKKVLVIDTDLGLRNLDIVLGMENTIVYNLVDLIQGKCTLEQVLLEKQEFPGFFFLPAAQTKDKSAISSEQMKTLLEQIKSEYDYILLDCPSGIEEGFYQAVAGADRAIVITTPEIASIRDADRVIGLLKKQGMHNNDLLINRIHVDLLRKGELIPVEEIEEILPVHLLGVILEDKELLRASNQGQTVIGTECPSAQAYHRICQRLNGEDVLFPDFKETERGFARLKHFFKK